MKPQELRNLYGKACDAKNYLPSTGQLATWREQLGHLEKADLERALAAWWEKNTAFPMPADLRALAAEYQRARDRKSDERTTYARWECPDCGMTCGGFIAPTDFKPQRCAGIPKDRRTTGSRICGARMLQIFREDKFSSADEAICGTDA